MEMQYAIWLYKEYKHEKGAHWAQALFPPKVSTFPSRIKATVYAKNMFGNLGWKFEVVPITGEHSFEHWADNFKGRHETSRKQLYDRWEDSKPTEH